jgi:hypothetical protein
LFALAAASGVHYRAAAAGSHSWSDTASGENEYVDSCKGFAITTSYASNLNYDVVENYSGDPVVENLNVTFAGALANSVTGTSLPYSGKFTRTSYYHIGRVTVSDLELRIGLPTPGDFTVKVAHQEMDLGSNPKDVLHAFAQQQLESGICVLLGRNINGAGVNAPGFVQPTIIGLPDVNSTAKVHTENSALPAPAEPVPNYPAGCVATNRHGIPCRG